MQLVLSVMQTPLSDMMEAAPFGYLRVTADGVIVAANKQARALLGAGASQVFADMVAPADLADFHELLAGRVAIAEARLILARGEPLVELQCAAATTPDGVIETHLYLRDITDNQATRNALDASKRQHKQLVHDLGNAFTVSAGYTELVSATLDSGEPLQGEHLTRLRSYFAEVESAQLKAEALLSRRRIPRPATPTPTRESGDMRVIVVDDDAAVAEFMAGLVRALGHQVRIFTCSNEALEFITSQQGPLDLLVLDQLMPGMSGISLATELLALDIHVPIILCSGDPDLIAEQASGRLKIQHFISKPIDIAAFSQMVDDLMALGSTQGS